MRLAMRVGVIKAHHVEPSGPRLPKGLDVIPGVYQESIGALVQIFRANGFDHAVRSPNQQPTAFGRQRGSRVSHDGIKNLPGQDHSTSMAIAMPMPPPIQRVATP